MTLTTDRFNEIYENPEQCSYSEIQEMAAMLANRESQPAGFYTTVSGRKGVVWHNGAPEDDTAIYTAPPAPAVPEDVQHLKNVQELYHRQEKRLFALAQRIKGASFDKYSHTTAQAIDVLEREIFGDDGDACLAAMLAQPVSQRYTLPPHAFRELVNSLRDTAVKYQGTQQLREQLSRTLTENGLVAVAPESGNDHDTRR